MPTSSRSQVFDRTRPPEERYRVLGRFAVGTMAEVFLARALMRSGETREVVVKQLLLNADDEEELIKMFVDEATIASRLVHPNIIEIYELFELGEPSRKLCIAMDLVRGVNLSELNDRLLVRGARMPVAIGLAIAIAVLEALEYAHAFRDVDGRHLALVHRDIAPQNILVSWEGGIKLIDFGVAKAEGRLQKTRAGGLKGKLGYMAPEQIAGLEVDHRSDLFALGEVLFQILYGVHPFHAEIESEFLSAIVGGRPATLPPGDQHVPADVAALLLRALQLHPDKRFQSAREMRDALLSRFARPAPADQIGRFVREIFHDRYNLEVRARNERNDTLLVESMRVGSQIEPELYEIDDMPTHDGFGDSGRNEGVTVIDHQSAAAVRTDEMPRLTALGDYLLDQRLRAGVVGDVFAARRQHLLGLERRVELEIVDARLTRELRAREIILEAALRTAQVLHPHVVQIFDIGADSGQFFLAWEHVEGWTLAEITAKCAEDEVQMPVGLACRITADVCGALNAAHRAHEPLIHGALGPENVIVSRHGEVKVIGFGMARARSPAVAGDERADVEAAAGLLHAMRSDPPRALDIIAAHAVKRAATERYSIAKAFQMDLENFLSRLEETTAPFSLGTWMVHLFEGVP